MDPVSESSVTDPTVGLSDSDFEEYAELLAVDAVSRASKSGEFK